MSSVALQLLTHGRADTLPALFDSLTQQTDQDWTLWLLINGAAPEVQSEIESIIDRYQDRLPMNVQVSHENQGFAGGHQYLYQQHRDELVLLVNDDVELEPIYIETLRTYLNDHADVGAVSGALLRPDGSIDTLGMCRLPTGKVIDRDQGSMMTKLPTEPYEVFGVSGALPMIRRSSVTIASLDAQLFDPLFETYKEDVDLAYRFRAHGIRSVVVPSAVAVHHRTFRASRLHRGVSIYAAARSYRNHLWILLTYYSWIDYLRHAWAIIPFEVAKMVFLLLTKPRVVFWAFVSTGTHWGVIMRKRRFYL